MEIKQSPSGYRYSLDPFILADAVDARGTERIIDFGTGNGILPALLCRIFPKASYMGLEIQKPPLAYAKDNFPSTSSHMFINADVRTVPAMIRKGSFGLGVSNPPYRKANAGRMNPLHAKAIARHEITLTLNDICVAAAHAIMDGGRLILCHLAERSAELMHVLQKNSFAPSAVRYVYSKYGENAFMVVATSVKNGKNPVRILPPLYVYGENGKYSEDMEAIYRKFSCPEKSDY